MSWLLLVGLQHLGAERVMAHAMPSGERSVSAAEVYQAWQQEAGRALPHLVRASA